VDAGSSPSSSTGGHPPLFMIDEFFCEACAHVDLIGILKRLSIEVRVTLPVFGESVKEIWLPWNPKAKSVPSD
jgi:hypothetical protein